MFYIYMRVREGNFILSKFYRNFAFSFFGLAVILLLFVFYLIWAKVIIIITPVQQEISQDFIVEVKESAAIPTLADRNFISGKIEAIESEGTDTFLATGSKSLSSDIVGEVTIINNYSKDQTLAATTRLADPSKPSEVLVRLKKTVVVPAGKKIKVQVYPDKPEEFKKLLPMKFIIPGLWAPLQDKIYAENEKTLGEVGNVAVVSGDDLAKAKKTLKEKLFQQVISEINQKLEPQQTLWPKLVSADTTEINYTAQEGEEISEFSATMKLKTIVIIFNESEVIAAAREKLKSALPTSKQLTALDPKSLSYSVEKYDLSQKTAHIRVYVEGKSQVGEGSQIINKDNLLGQSAEEIKSYFSQYPEIKEVEVKFSPSWLKKTPRIKDKIEIEINK